MIGGSKIILKLKYFVTCSMNFKLVSHLWRLNLECSHGKEGDLSEGGFSLEAAMVVSVNLSALTNSKVHLVEVWEENKGIKTKTNFF